MSRLTLGHALAVLVAAGVTASTAGAQAANPAGPPYNFRTYIDYGGVTPLKNQAIIDRTKHGWRYRAGQQNSHLVVTRVSGGVRFVDTRTGSFKSLASACRKQRVARGVAAVCPVPSDVSPSRPLLIEVWPRLGDDYVDTSSLSANFAVSVLGDAGHDVSHFGAGPDFFNGAAGNDRVTGGGGRDWLRTGKDHDRIRGEGGNDYLIGTDGRDTIVGGGGNDRVGGGAASDVLYGNAGTDTVTCSGGSDVAHVDRWDTVRDCESVRRR